MLMQPKLFAVQDVKKVYLNQAIDAALENNIDLQAAKLERNIAKNNIKTANRLQNPSFDAFYFLGAAGNSEPKQLGVSENIEIAKRKARKNLAESNLKLVEKNIDYTIFDLKMDVREAYINLVEAKSILDTLEQQEELQEELLKIAKVRVKNHNAPDIDVIQAEIALNQMITQVNSARVNVKKALSDFNKVINNPDNIVYDSMDNIFSEENNFQEMMTPPPNFDFPSFDEIVQNAIRNRYDIQIAKQEIDVAEKNLTVTARQRIPDIQLTGGYAYQVGSYTDSGNFNNGAYAGASLVNIPLFYNYSPEIQNAALKLKQAELKYESSKNRAVKDVSAAYDRFLTAADNLNHYEKKIITGSEELIETSKNSYEAGKSDITSLIVMKQSYKSIIIGYTQALAEYYNSWTNFLREVNDEKFTLPEDL
ncbi:glr3618 protein [Acinetobacter sp. CAG:196]|nr:glr3618 protein [Acinetobacter sp. CAG:196]